MRAVYRRAGARASADPDAGTPGGGPARRPAYSGIGGPAPCGPAFPDGTYGEVARSWIAAGGIVSPAVVVPLAVLLTPDQLPVASRARSAK